MSAQRSAALVRRWVALYTLGLSPDIKQRRRDEIDDDLWCQAQDAAGASRADRSLGGEILARLVFGVPADVTWRIEQRRVGRPRPVPQRSLAMHTRTIAALALVGGSSWLTFLAFALPLGVLEGKYQGDPMPLLVLFLGGTLAMGLATIGLVAAAQDMISGSAATVAVIGAVVAAIVVFGFAGIFVGPPVGSALVVWQLGRVGALPAWPARAQLAAALIIVVDSVILKASPVLGLYGVLVFLAATALYALTWLAIGWSLLRSRPVATKGVSGASPA